MVSFVDRISFMYLLSSQRVGWIAISLIYTTSVVTPLGKRGESWALSKFGYNSV